MHATRPRLRCESCRERDGERVRVGRHVTHSVAAGVPKALQVHGNVTRIIVLLSGTVSRRLPSWGVTASGKDGQRG